MIRLIAFIIMFVLFLAFIVFNLGSDNKCDISFGFRTFKDIPVFVTALTSFVVGLLFALPFFLSIGRKRKKSFKENASNASPAKGMKKRRGLKNKNANPEDTESDGIFPGSGADEIKKEKSSYGID